MPAAPSTFSQIRFAPAGLGQMPPLVREHSHLDLLRVDGLALLEWLGLGRPDFGAIAARELAPLCRRRLWAVARNADPDLRTRAAALLTVAETAGDGMVLFG